jgi:hypothetical protein
MREAPERVDEKQSVRSSVATVGPLAFPAAFTASIATGVDHPPAVFELTKAAVSSGSLGIDVERYASSPTSRNAPIPGVDGTPTGIGVPNAVSGEQGPCESRYPRSA